jgi:hypothetical protein
LLVVYREVEFLIQPDGETDEFEGTRIETIGTIELTKNINAWNGMAKVLAVTGPVEVGDRFKMRDHNQ